MRFRDAEDALNQANSIAAGIATEELVTGMHIETAGVKLCSLVCAHAITTSLASG